MDVSWGRRDPSPAENGLVLFNTSVRLIVYKDSKEHNASNNVVLARRQFGKSNRNILILIC